eukprot:CAMPEP_0179013624 /NCGR_PEP_ID=MMETSP0796-20121207/1825_1 /TAXON_ID=73915 /ORGANISM="Pyrodinium bahamense, Strain pbaha01" /LENGTH=1076 /DNA_ID=CAMNT_0020709139 /DNA_START=45 /DNA_END=3273 /DNA_ORIENTATION=+
MVGDGIRAFLGDCRSPGGNSRRCLAGKEASLAFPVSIAIDDEDNLYIADYGNNRVRMWTPSANYIVTIAGTGEIGFSGDGGEARLARLRQPEGIAVRPRGQGDGPLQVYFSDFNNQRIRRLVWTGERWIIHTVAGTGVKGDKGVDCDTGCDARTEAVLNNPRALAFSSEADLYIADSGNRKIRKVTPGGVFSTFVGMNSRAPSRDSFSGLGSLLLPGHWEEPYQHQSLGTLYFLNIDHADNLWFVDGPGNRVWKTPLNSRSRKIVNGYSRRLVEHYLMQFTSTPEQKLSIPDSVLEGIMAWTEAEFNFSSSVRTVTYMVGKSSWTYGKGEQGTWCEKGSGFGTKDGCKPAQAQYARFSSIMGFCFDVADNMYVSDFTSSEVLYLNREEPGYAGVRWVVDPGNEPGRLTTRGCTCYKYWYDIRTEGDSSSNLFVNDEHRATMCRENPKVIEMARRVQNGETIAGDIRTLTSVDLVPPCVTTDYCHAGITGIQQCFIEQGAGQRQCKRDWGFCNRPLLGTSWEMAPLAAMLGNEIRFQSLQNVTEAVVKYDIEAYLTEDLWFQPPRGGDFSVGDIMQADSAIESDISLYSNTTILAGFVSAEPLPDGCSSRCCGLPELEAEVEADGPMCALRTRSDIATLKAFFANHTNMWIVWHKLDTTVEIREDGGSGAMNLMDCQDRCMLDPRCKSFMVAYNETTRSTAAKSACVYFTQNFPFYIYQFDRSGIDESSAASLSRSELDKLRDRFEGPVSPYSRIFNPMSSVGLYVTGNGYHTTDMPNGTAPHPEAGLNLAECEELCIKTANCHAIAFPGCYLLHRQGIAAQTGKPRGVTTAVFAKSRRGETLEGVVGRSEVYAFKGDGDYLREAYLNRPAGCAVNSKGEVLFTDVWNQRIRKITGYQLDCLYAVTVGRDVYTRAIAAVARSCNAMAAMGELYAAAQQEVVLHRNASAVDRVLCEFRNASAVDPDYLETNNTFVLCTFCQEWAEGDPARPDICPPQELCACRENIVEVLRTEVYRNCPRQSAYHDKWHIWITSYLRCPAQGGEDMQWLLNSALRTQLKNQLVNYSNYSNQIASSPSR